MKQLAGLTAVGAAFVVAFGCRNPDDQLVGTWKFKDLEANGSHEPGFFDFRDQLAAEKPTVTFGKDYAFTLVIGGAPDVGGAWRMKDNQVGIHVATLHGKPLAEVRAEINQVVESDPTKTLRRPVISEWLPGSLSSDGSTFTLHRWVTRAMAMTFTKSE